VFLQLEAASERRPADSLAPDELLPDGSNIARVLARIESETKTTDRPRGQLTDIRNALAALIPGVSDLRVERDPSGRSYQLLVLMSDGSEFSSRVLSDGTLRILALLTFLYEPRLKTALLFEEPENGVHEERLKKLVDILRNSCADWSSDNSDRIFQIILNTHSPIVLHQTHTHELVVADVVSMVDPVSRKVIRRTRMRTGVVDTTQGELDFDLRERRLTRIEAERIVRHGKNFAA
jgi:predicted ATPase